MATTLTGYPFDTGFDTVSYEDRFTEYFQFLSGGAGVIPYSSADVFGAYANQMRVFGDSTGMQVKVYQGRVFIKGHFAKIADADAPSGFVTQAIAAADATNPRLDRIVARLNKSANTITIDVVTGTPAATPAATALTQGNTTWEVPLALVYVPAAASTITAMDVIDDRVFVMTPEHARRVVNSAFPIVNGGFDLAQFGASFAAVADGTLTLDRWRYSKAGAVVHTVTQDTNVPAIGENAPKLNFSYKMAVTTADASIAAGDYAFVDTRIEGYNWEPYAQREFCFGIWVMSSVVGMHHVALVNSGNDRSCVIPIWISAVSTWEYKVIRVPASPSAGTWNYTSSVGVRICFVTSAGSTFQTTAPYSWQTGLFFATARQVNVSSTITQAFQIAAVGPLTLGPVPLPFAPQPYDQELTRAQHYRRRINAGANSNPIGVAHAYASNGVTLPLVWPVTMRAAPTITVSANGDIKVSNADISAFGTGTVSAITNPTVDGGMLNITAIGTVTLTAGQCVDVRWNNANGYIDIDAEL